MTIGEKDQIPKEPTTPDELKTLHELLRSDPQRYLRTVHEWIQQNPKNHHAYFERHFAWMRTGEPRKALEDLNKAIELEPTPHVISFLSRGEIYRHLGEYEHALEDFSRGEAMNPKEWVEDTVFGLLYQADCHARLGDEASALSCCRRLPEDFWTPGIAGAPSGGKADIANKLRQIASEARRKRNS